MTNRIVMSAVLFAGCSFAGDTLIDPGNTGLPASAALEIIDAAPVMIENSAHRFGAVADASLLNCIVWNNAPSPMGGATTATFSVLESASAGAGNLSADPLLWGGVSHDVHLRAGSPCIDAGDPASPPDANGTRADIGAFAFDATYFTPPQRYCTPKTNSLGCVPRLEWAGTPTLTGPDDFVVYAPQAINQKSSIVFFGFSATPTPFYDAVLCTAAPVRRGPISSTGGAAQGFDCSGVVFDAFTQADTAYWGLGAGARIQMQAWYRDPGFAVPNSFGLTDALEVVIGP